MSLFLKTSASFDYKPFPTNVLPDFASSPTVASVSDPTFNFICQTSYNLYHCFRFIPFPFFLDLILESNSLDLATEVDRNRMLSLSSAFLKTNLYFNSHPLRVLIDSGSQEDFVSANFVPNPSLPFYSQRYYLSLFDILSWLAF